MQRDNAMFEGRMQKKSSLPPIAEYVLIRASFFH